MVDSRFGSAQQLSWSRVTQMTAAHFAAAVAIKSRVPKASTTVLIFAAFIPDFIWIILATSGIEPTKRENFFDDWSHSLLMILVYATIYSLLFWKRGRSVLVAIWLAVFSHFILDMPVHPKDLALYPTRRCTWDWAFHRPLR
jgi:hypothetical protein